MSFALSVSVQSTPTIIEVSVGVTFVSCVLVLVLAAVEGHVPKWALPLPLSFAASDGYSRLLFRVGLTIAAVMMTFSLPVTTAAYRHLMPLFPWPGIVLVLPLHLSMYLTVICFFLLALVPFDKKALEPLRRSGYLEVPRHAGNVVHQLAAGMFFISCFMTFLVVVAVSMLSVQTKEMDLYLTSWWWLLLLPLISQASMRLSLRLFKRLEDEGGVVDADDARNRRLRRIRGCGAAQIGILSSILVFVFMVALDVRQVCAVGSSACEATTFDLHVMNAVLVAFVAAACTIGAFEMHQRWHRQPVSLGYVLLAC